MKQQKDSSTKVKKMKLEKSYSEKGKRMNVKGKIHGKRGRSDKHDDDDDQDDFYDLD